MKNKKISDGLKKYHSHQKTKQIVKKGLLITIPLIIAICLISEWSERTNAYIGDFKTISNAERTNIQEEAKLIAEMVRINQKQPLSVKEQIEKIAEEENFKYTEYLLKLAFCESRFNPKAINDNGLYLRDFGVFQINEYFHGHITQEQAEDVEFATKWTMDKINKGQQNLWACDKIVKGKTKEQLGYKY